MTWRIKLQYGAAAVALGVAAFSGSQFARLLAAVGCVCAIVSAELAYRVALMRLEDEVAKWHRRWREEHKAFQEWIAIEHRRRARPSESD